jgi:tetratricopeptide (TPR) repeat protein
LAADENGVACSTNNIAFRQTLRRLKKSALLEVTSSDGSNIYSLHPLIKDYIKNSLSPEEQITIHLELLKYARSASFITEPLSLQDLQPFFDLYYHLIGSKQYDKAFSIIRAKSKATQQNVLLFSRLFWWGHYSLAYDFLLAPLLEAHQNQQWKPSSEKLSYLYRQAGNVMAKAKSTSEAERLYKTAIKAASGDLASMSNPVQQYLCELYIEAGRLYQAQQVLSEIKSMHDRVETYSESYRLIGREGYINAALGNVSIAIKQLKQAIHLSSDKQNGDQGYECLFHRVLGDLYVNTEMFHEAWEVYKRGLELARDPDNHRDYEGHILRGEADIHRLQGDVERAAQLYNESLTIALTTGSLWLETEVLVGIANVLLLQDDCKTASLKAEEALSIAHTGGWLISQIRCHIILAQIAIIGGDLLVARDHFNSAESLTKESGFYWSRLPLKVLNEQLMEGR